ncbi:hypothetical protein [Planococcus maitriensis]|uniref:Uncharacterized protein n=1 Tax=Planococcus maitriensis TaxID=221799 RepID=A0A365K8T1_9BACL|nr:hypothetical protein [Planococcus maitriensis]RAZ69182.1 hypothetical protein DP119_00520 [Planococcus maitriensis]
MAFWNFPVVIGGNINSINNAGLETFRDDPIDSLTREICQNSLDAVEDESKPVIVEFKKFTSNVFPGKDELRNNFERAKMTWEGKNKKSTEFIESALNILSERNMQWLRISDFNTRGLEGARAGEIGSPWSALVREAGSSNKNDSSGGSFGIGKAAPFLSSGLRTIFYSSLDRTGYRSYIGVSDIMSFQKDGGGMTVGKGYYTDGEDSRAIPDSLKLDSGFEREEAGTDIFISAFIDIYDLEKKILHSILHNFFLTVYYQKLIVRVGDSEINHKNINELIKKLEEDSKENKDLKNFFNLLSSENTLRIEYPSKRYDQGRIEFKDGEAVFLLMEGEDFNRKVLMTRKTGMKIFEQGHISGNITFTGMLMIQGENMNRIFKEMENPAHNKWVPSRYEENPKIAEQIFKDLRKFMRDTVKESFSPPISDQMNAFGLSDFIPDKRNLNQGDEQLVESLDSVVTKIEMKKKNRKAASTIFEDERESENEASIDRGENALGDGERGGFGEEEAGEGDSSNNGTQLPEGEVGVDPNSDGNVDISESRRKRKLVANKCRYISLNQKEGLYRFSVVLDKAFEKGTIEFKQIGEQNIVKLPIENVAFDQQDIKIEKINNNEVVFLNGKKVQKLSFLLKIKYSNLCAMEVQVYENS